MTPFAPTNGHTPSVLDTYSSRPPISVKECQPLIASPLANGENGDGRSAPPLANGDNGAGSTAPPLANGDNGEKLAAHPTSPSGRSGREASGRFAKGNTGGPGNPFARKTAALRRAFCEAVTEDDVRSLAQQLLVKAREGDLAAVKVLFAYAIGRPTEAVDPDTLDLDEWQLFLRNPADVTEVKRILNSLPSSLACTLLRTMLPFTESRLKNEVVEMCAPAPEKKRRTGKGMGENGQLG
ncbi:MAG TPA: hypothetical protein VGG61_04230 [Gemmataceae bacterium]|jgi:hypothetical protein